MVSANVFIKTAKSVLCEKRVKFIKKTDAILVGEYNKIILFYKLS